LLFNVIIFILVIRQLTCKAGKIKGSSKASKRNKVMKRLQNAAAISVLLGLTWVFGLLSVFESSNFIFQVLFCVFNSLQGFFIFVLFVIRQDTIREHFGNLVFGKKEASTASSTSKQLITWKIVESTVKRTDGDTLERQGVGDQKTGTGVVAQETKNRD